MFINLSASRWMPIRCWEWLSHVLRVPFRRTQEKLTVVCSVMDHPTLRGKVENKIIFGSNSAMLTLLNTAKTFWHVLKGQHQFHKTKSKAMSIWECHVPSYNLSHKNASTTYAFLYALSSSVRPTDTTASHGIYLANLDHLSSCLLFSSYFSCHLLIDF